MRSDILNALKAQQKAQEVKVATLSHRVRSGIRRGTLEKRLIDVWYTELHEHYQRLVDGSYLTSEVWDYLLDSDKDWSQQVGWTRCTAELRDKYESAKLAFHQWKISEDQSKISNELDWLCKRMERYTSQLVSVKDIHSQKFYESKLQETRNDILRLEKNCRYYPDGDWTVVNDRIENLLKRCEKVLCEVSGGLLDRVSSRPEDCNVVCFSDCNASIQLSADVEVSNSTTSRIPSVTVSYRDGESLLVPGHEPVANKAELTPALNESNSSVTVSSMCLTNQQFAAPASVSPPIVDETPVAEFIEVIDRPIGSREGESLQIVHEAPVAEHTAEVDRYQSPSEIKYEASPGGHVSVCSNDTSSDVSFRNVFPTVDQIGIRIDSKPSSVSPLLFILQHGCGWRPADLLTSVSGKSLPHVDAVRGSGGPCCTSQCQTTPLVSLDEYHIGFSPHIGFSSHIDAGLSRVE